MSGYCYRFLNQDGEILYIGKTKNISQRMLQHKNHGHLTSEQYQQITKVQIMKFPTYNDAGLCERYFISKYNPLFNQSMTKEGNITIELNIDYKWEDYDIDLSNKNLNRIRNKSVINFERILNKVCMIDTTGHTFILYKINSKPVEYLYCSKDDFENRNDQLKDALWMPEEFVQNFLEYSKEKSIPIVYGFLLTDNMWQQKCSELWDNIDKENPDEIKKFKNEMDILTSECHYINLNKLLKHPEFDYEYQNPDYRKEIRIKVSDYINRNFKDLL